jgi:hypothetical protein
VRRLSRGHGRRQRRGSRALRALVRAGGNAHRRGARRVRRRGAPLYADAPPDAAIRGAGAAGRAAANSRRGGPARPGWCGPAAGAGGRDCSGAHHARAVAARERAELRVHGDRRAAGALAAGRCPRCCGGFRRRSGCAWPANAASWPS